MKATDTNPFPVAGYRGAEFFCDREEESRKLLSALRNGRNITLISPRRMGKTGLIQHVFQQIERTRADYVCFYIDIFSTQNLTDFTSLIGKAVVGKLDDFSQAALKKITSLLKSFRPRFSIDPHSGVPEMVLDISTESSETGLQEVFTYIRDSGKKCLIALDEFQQITTYPEGGVEALLRSQIQFVPNAVFIFSGSEKHLMDEMFSSAKRPFYQSAQKITLGPIPQESYCDFACKKFRAAGRELPEALFEQIYNLLSGHTWYVQLILNILYSDGMKRVNEKDIKRVIDGILYEEDATYKTYCKMLTSGQLNVLRAVAQEGRLTSPGSSAFLSKYNLGAASSVRLALLALAEKSLLLQDNEGAYSVYDRFFGLWLARTGG